MGGTEFTATALSLPPTVSLPPKPVLELLQRPQRHQRVRFLLHPGNRMERHRDYRHKRRHGRRREHPIRQAIMAEQATVYPPMATATCPISFWLPHPTTTATSSARRAVARPDIVATPTRPSRSSAELLPLRPPSPASPLWPIRNWERARATSTRRFTHSPPASPWAFNDITTGDNKIGLHREFQRLARPLVAPSATPLAPATTSPPDGARSTPPASSTLSPDSPPNPHLSCLPAVPIVSPLLVARRILHHISVVRGKG